MGESYFTHIGVTPHRIYPFVVTNFNPGYNGQAHGTTSLTMLKNLWMLLYWDNHDSFMKTAAMALQNVMDSDMCVRRSFDFSMASEAQKATISEANVLSYSGVGTSSTNTTGETEKGDKTSSISEELFRSPRTPS